MFKMSNVLQQNIFGSTIFVVVTLIVSIFIIGVLIGNIVYFGKVVDNDDEDRIFIIGRSSARAMYYLNIFMLIPVIGIMIYSIFRLVAGNKTLAYARQVALSEPTGLKRFQIAE
jgi:hypothetical protein